MKRSKLYKMAEISDKEYSDKTKLLVIKATHCAISLTKCVWVKDISFKLTISKYIHSLFDVKFKKNPVFYFLFKVVKFVYKFLKQMFKYL